MKTNDAIAETILYTRLITAKWV